MPRLPASHADCPAQMDCCLPPTASILRGDLATDEFMRSFLLPRDLELCEGNPDPRPILEAFIRHLALGDTLRATQARLEVERKARLDLESQLQVSETKRKSLEDKYAQLQTLRARENHMHGKVLASVLSDYKSSKAFKEDARKYLVEHMEELFTDWAATPAGRDRIGMEGLLMYDVGQYTLQRDIYVILRNRDETFDPVEWGLPVEFENPDPVALAELTEAVKEEMAAGSPRE
ncbi:uncharacterized protein LOC116032332 [Ipomoea triloba]|uniref:uncharacterized protein LOC116032332 n=1 Tax=Ipomoea triloba TaxID=35885 RepID=UPI00125DC6B9|nr:uncharacterized protein LOC116032332 [Ipomoea triloba]